MLPPNDPLLSALSAGPLSAAELGARLGLSQPSISRRLAQAVLEVMPIGPLRGRRYARRRATSHGALDIFRVNAQGQLEGIGQLSPAAPGGFVFLPTDPHQHSRWHDGLPWWLQDMRPQGFLGRAYARRLNPVLGLPPDPRDWQDGDALQAMCCAGEDGIGNLLVGEDMREAWLARQDEAIPPWDVAARYPQLAQLAMQGETVGSSAGGEQPKFLATVEDDAGPRHVLVKFSSAQDNAVARRWKNLLACEHLALSALQRAGLPAADSRIVDAGTQRFLEIRRFDRVGAQGRRGLVSLAALDHEFTGRADAAWPVAVEALHAAGRVDAAALDLARRLYAFGVLIGNGDMHHGNLSFHHDGPAPYRLAPAYDMLPMSLAPRASGEIADDVPLRLPAMPAKAVWVEMLPVAQRYWADVLDSEWIDAPFRAVVRGMQQRLAYAQEQLARLA